MLLDRYGDMLTPVDCGCGSAGFVVQTTDDLTLECSYASEGIYEITVSSSGSSSEGSVIALTLPLADATAFWQPGIRGSVPLAPDWHGDVAVSLVKSAPMGCLLDAGDNCLFGFGFSLAVGESTMQYGVDEERDLFVVFLRFRMHGGRERLLVMDAAASLTLIDAGRQLSAFIRGDYDRMPAPDNAREPVFSTWYARLQDVTSDYLLSEADGMAALGCRSVFVDDGWQEKAHGRGYAGCGDWIADSVKFPDLKKTVDLLHDKGLSVILWIAPLLVGEKSKAWQDVSDQNPIYLPGQDLNVHVLDPRRAVNRSHIARTCRRLMDEYGADGLKIDFLDQASRYQGLAAPTGDDDCDDVGEAMLALLSAVKTVISEGRSNPPIVEFRSPYVNPVLGSYANVLRASDCPSDSIANRCGVMDARIISDGRIVDSDMLLWNVGSRPTACAQQIMSAFFGVPQISVTPSVMTPSQQAVCQRLLNLWRKYRQVILDGRLTAGAQALAYPVISAVGDGTQITGVYAQNVVVDVDARDTHHLVLLNATNSCVVTIRMRGLICDHPLQLIATDAAGARERNNVVDSHVDNGTSIADMLVEPFGVLEMNW